MHISFVVWLLPFSVLGQATLGSAGDAPRLSFARVDLPTLELVGKVVDAHTQGLWVGETYTFATARRDDVAPRRALLLRTRPAAQTTWDVWDITPPQRWPGRQRFLDHAGGFDSDGERLWIPVAESRRHGKTYIRAYRMDRLKPDALAPVDSEFFVDDHIGAVAVSKERKLLYGASWDTLDVYVWNFEGGLKQRFAPSALAALQLGVAPPPNARRGLAVQDWKIRDDWLIASGLYKLPAGKVVPPRSRLFLFQLTKTGLGDAFRSVRQVELPLQGGTELSREGMALKGADVYFLPEDFHDAQRAWRAPLKPLLGPDE